MAAMRAGEVNLTSKPPNSNNPTRNPDECSIPIPTNDIISNNNSCPSPVTERFCPTPNRPPKIPTEPGPGLTRRSTFKCKPKSRFGEPSLPIDSETLEIYGTPRGEAEFTFPSPARSRGGSPICNSQAGSLAHRSGRKGETVDEIDEREVYKRVTAQLSARNHMRMTVKFLVEFAVFVVILSCLVCSFTVERMRGVQFYGLRLWKWFVLLMVIFSGMLMTQWVVHLAVFIIEWKFILRKNVVYFTHALKTNVEVFIWIGVVLATWVSLFKPDVDHPSYKIRKFLDFVTWTLASLLIGSFLWLIKTTLLKLLASSFHLNRFFDRIQNSVFDHYVLQILSGRPVMSYVQQATADRIDDAAAQVSFNEHVKSHTEKKKVDVGKLYQMKRDKVPSYTMQLLVDVVSNSGLSTMSDILEEDHVEGGVELDDDEITSEEQAIVTAVRIFENITKRKNDKDYIDRNDFLRFMMEEEVDLLFPLFDTNEKGKISLKDFSKWVVKVFKDRQQLQHALNDNKTAVRQLNKIVIAILIVVVFILWLLLTELASTKLLLFFSSQLVVAAFIFGNTCKTIFEAIIFVFVMHPFDVGDRCVVDGIMMVVEEMNILTTVMLKADKEKVYYPNSVLATKPISNFYRSPDNQGDTVEFSIDFMTPLEDIGKMKNGIKNYLLGNPQFWHPEHSVVVKEIENVNKIKIALYVNHTMNFQDIVEKNRRRTELVLELKRIFEDLHIRCNLLPQEVILNSKPAVLHATSQI